MHCRPTDGSGFFRHPFPNRHIRRRQFIHAFPQSLRVEHRTAHDKREPPARRNFGHEPQGICPKVCGRITLVDVPDINQMMRTNREFFLRGFGGADVHTAVNEGRIDRNNFHRMPSRQFQRQSRLTACGRAQNHQSTIRHHCPRKKSLSSSLMETTVQVGRPWLH